MGTDNTQTPVDTAVIPLAGLGTRMYPFAAEMPKFMTPVIDGDRAVPVIDYTLADLLGAGIRNIVFVVSRGGEEALRKHLGPIDKEVVAALRALGKDAALEAEEQRRAAFKDMNLVFVEQPLIGRYGTTIPPSLARPALAGVKRFAEYGGDDFIWHKDGTSELGLMLEGLAASGADNALMGQVVPREKGSLYGILQQRDDGFLKEIDEQPPEERVPAEPLANTSRYIFTDDVWRYIDADLARPRTPDRKEYRITDVVNEMAADGHDFYMHTAQGWYLDAGSPQNLLRAGIVISDIHT